MNYFVIVVLIFFLLLLLGKPIALVILFSAMLGLFLKGVPLTVLIPNMYNQLISFTYLAVPMYIFAGALLNELGIAERIFNFANSIVGHIRGGLGHVNILASMIFAGMSGSSTADVAGLGRVEMEAMNKAGYDPAFSAAITATSSILGPIIPPSVHMMIFATIAEVPAAAILMGGLLPGILMGLSLMITIYIIALTGKVKCPITSSGFQLSTIFQKFKEGFWALLAPIIIVGSILGGFATATEAGVIAVAYTLLIGKFIYKTLNISKIQKCLNISLYSLGVVSFIIAVSKIFTWYITIENIPEQFMSFVYSITDNHILIILLIVLLIILLGCVATASANIILVTPIIMPLLVSIGFHPIHIGVIIVFGLVIGIITPPVGASLYIACDVSGVSFENLIKKMWPFYIPLIIGFLLVIFFPALTLYIPQILKIV
ncbi:MAG: TRAP transporter large permease [Eubacteriales bacterium]